MLNIIVMVVHHNTYVILQPVHA